jgi:hypothetical protein
VSALSARDRALLEFHHRWLADHGPIRDTEERLRERVLDVFGLSINRYVQILRRLAAHPEAIAHRPQLTARIRRGSETRRARHARWWEHPDGAGW